MKKKIILSVLGAVLLMCFLAACQTTGSAGASMAGTFAETGGASRTAAENDASAYTADTPISDVIQDPVFGDYGRLIFPVNSSYYRGDTLGELSLTWYSHIDPEKTVEIANYMREHAAAGETIFYDIYTEEEKAQDPAKEDTGLFFFRGNPGTKFAVCNAGGGFAYVGAMHDSFPHALELSKMGYNAFALIYRPGAQTACEDLARAIAFIFGHAEELQVDTADYSLWGGSAGGRMAAWVGSYGTAAFGEEALPRPAAVIMQYTGYSEYSENDPPTYACVGDQDGIASWRTMEERLNRLQEFGTDTEFHVYPGLGHGFGLGTGTAAEGWLQDAVSFWEKHMENPPENASPDSGLEQGLQAVEEAMAAGSRDASEMEEGGEDLRQGTSENTIGTPEDFSAAYDYGSGRMEDWSRAVRFIRKNADIYGIAPEDIAVMGLNPGRRIPDAL